MSNYSPQAQKLLPILQKHQRLNLIADHVIATCGLNMKTGLRYGQTPSHLYYTAQPRGSCGRTAFIITGVIKTAKTNHIARLKQGTRLTCALVSELVQKPMIWIRQNCEAYDVG